MATCVQAPPAPPNPTSHVPAKLVGANGTHRRESASSKRKGSSISSEDPNRIPSADQTFASDLIPVYNAKGEMVPFERLHSGEGRHLVIWVRHFFCGMCQDYLRSLSEIITPAALAALPQPTTISIVGCGSSDLIDDYASFSGNCPFPIYADPDRKTHDIFDMATNLSLGPASPDYQTSSLTHIIVRSIWQGITSGTLAVKGGKQSQLGGEMLFEDGKVVFCHRMQNTRDHTAPGEIKKLLGL